MSEEHIREGEGSHTGDANETVVFRPEDFLTPEQMAAGQGPTREDIKRFANERAAADKVAAEAARARIAATPDEPGPKAGFFEPVDPTQPLSSVEAAGIQEASWMAGGDAESARATEETQPTQKGGVGGFFRRLFRRE